MELVWCAELWPGEKAMVNRNKNKRLIGKQLNFPIALISLKIFLNLH